MSSGYRNAEWLRRLWAIAKPDPPWTEHVANIQIVNDRRWASSREFAPYGAHGGLIAAPPAGSHNFVEIGGLDALGTTVNLLHYLRAELSQANALTGLLRIAIADGSSLTTASRVATTPLIADSDPDVSLTLFEGVITTANLPATAELLPKTNGIGQTAATPAFPTAVTEIAPLAGLPFAASWLGPRNLMIFGGDAEVLGYWVSWQAMRA